MVTESSEPPTMQVDRDEQLEAALEFIRTQRLAGQDYRLDYGDHVSGEVVGACMREMVRRWPA